MSSTKTPPTSGVETEEFFSAEETERRMNILLRGMGKNPLSEEEQKVLADIRRRNGG